MTMIAQSVRPRSGKGNPSVHLLNITSDLKQRQNLSLTEGSCENLNRVMVSGSERDIANSRVLSTRGRWCGGEVVSELIMIYVHNVCQVVLRLAYVDMMGQLVINNRMILQYFSKNWKIR